MGKHDERKREQNGERERERERRRDGRTGAISGRQKVDEVAREESS